MNTPETQPPASLGAAHGSAKWVVRDLTRRLPDQECDTKEIAEKWVMHLLEWQPAARPAVIPPNNQ